MALSDDDLRQFIGTGQWRCTVEELQEALTRIFERKEQRARGKAKYPGLTHKRQELWEEADVYRFKMERYWDGTHPSWLHSMQTWESHIRECYSVPFDHRKFPGVPAGFCNVPAEKLREELFNALGFLAAWLDCLNQTNPRTEADAKHAAHEREVWIRERE